METLELMASRHIKNQTALEAFLRYCKVYCGWSCDSQVDAKSVETCLGNFKKDHPKHAQYVS